MTVKFGMMRIHLTTLRKSGALAGKPEQRCLGSVIIHKDREPGVVKVAQNHGMQTYVLGESKTLKELEAWLSQKSSFNLWARKVTLPKLIKDNLAQIYKEAYAKAPADTKAICKEKETEKVLGMLIQDGRVSGGDGYAVTLSDSHKMLKPDRRSKDA